MPGRVSFSPTRSGRNPRSIPDPPWKRKKKSAIAVSRSLLLVPGSLRMSQVSLRPSQYVLDRIGVESYHNLHLIGSQSGNDHELSEEVWDFLRTIAELDLYSIAPPIIHVFHRLSRIKGRWTNWVLILW